MADLVFLGPTLPADEARELLPGVTVVPPVRHGDLLRLAPGAGDRVLIVDGLFLQTPPVRHREILLALERGAVVAGSSSMGALRAAELHPYGMRGAGTVFEMYRDGVVTGDDEVAMAYGPAEDGYPALSEPLVNVRVSLNRATGAGVVSAAEAAVLLALARSVSFRVRGARALARVAARELDGDGAAAAARWLAWARERPVDVKAEDARLLLDLAARGALAPASGADAPIENVETRLLERWRARHGGQQVAGRLVSDAETVAALLALHPDVPALRRRAVLAHLAGPDPGPSAEARVVAVARERGLVRADGGVSAGGWLAPAEATLPPEERALRVLSRAFGTQDASCRSERALPAELRAADVVTAARRFVRKAAAVADRLPRPDPHRPEHRLSFRPDAIDALFCRLWDCPAAELAPRAADRGFADLVAFRAAVEPFAALLTVAGAPDFPSVRAGG